MKPAFPFAILLFAAAAVSAQEEGTQLDRIEVTGSRITYRDLLDTPAISITRPGDYLLQEIRLVNDSRAEDIRTRELHQTILKLLDAGGDRYRLLHGDAYRAVLDRANHAVEPEEDEERPDTSFITLQLRIDLEGRIAEAESIIQHMREFARDTQGVGRTEIETVGETALGMSRPERFRYELIAAIARDTGEVTKALELACKIDIEGLNSRIEWQRVSAAELLLYIPYSMKVAECQPGSAPQPAARGGGTSVGM